MLRLNFLTDILNNNKNKKQDTIFNGALLIAQENQIVLQTAEGIYDHPKINTQFGIGSISKQITAAVILQLAEAKLINLEQSLQTYLPDLQETWSSQVTIKQCLNHTSGIVRLGESLAFPPGTQFQYCNISYFLLSKIAEKVSGKTFYTLIKNLLRSANMQNSGLFIAADYKTNKHIYKKLSMGFDEENGSLRLVEKFPDQENLRYETIHASGGVISTVYDLLAWNLTLHSNNSKLLSKKSYEMMITPSSQRDHPRYGKIGYGFGLQILDRDNILEISHSGRIAGYTSTLLYYPQNKISVIILENISLDLNNITRCFVIHDEIRKSIRERFY